jgi:hypothetical protein
MNTLKIVILSFLIIPVLVIGQSSAVDNLFDKYTSQDGFTSVDVSKGLFELFAEIEADDPEFEDFQKAIDGIESLRLIAYSTNDDDGGNTVASKEAFYRDVMNSIPFNDFKELMIIKDNDANVNFYAKSSGSVISEMIMVVDGNDEAVLLSLTGNLDLNYVAKLGKSMDIGGMQHLRKMDKDHDND